jgi:hypothetical protein
MMRVPEKIVFAVMFGVIFGLFLTLTPLGDVFKPIDCWDYQEDFLFSKDQLALVFCAALAFFIQTLAKTGGWKGFFKTIAVSYLCFQPYSLVAVYDAVYSKQCFFPKSLAEIPALYLLRLITAALLLSAVAAFICATLLVIYKRLLASPFRKKDDFTKLDLDAK